MPDNENKKQIKSRQRVADHGDYNIKSLMPFRQLLDRCKVEDDVRAAYAKFFDIPFDASEYIDLYTPQVLFEFKYDKTPQEALDQARTKEYGNPWLDSSLPVFHVGVNYDPEKRGINDPLVEPA